MFGKLFPGKARKAAREHRTDTAWPLRPASLALALEPRMMFDAALARTATTVLADDHGLDALIQDRGSWTDDKLAEALTQLAATPAQEAPTHEAPVQELRSAGVVAPSTNTPPTLEVSVSPVNAGTGRDIAITSLSLRASDRESPPSDIVFTVGRAPVNGTLVLRDASNPTLSRDLRVGSQFTQQDVDEGRLYFLKPEAGRLVPPTDSFGFTVSDGSGGSIGPRNLQINFDRGSVGMLELWNGSAWGVPTGYRPVILHQGDTAILDPAVLERLDPDLLNDRASVRYRITELPTQGQVLLNNVPAGVGDTFSQDDVDRFAVVYRHDGSRPTSASSTDMLHLTLEDGSLELVNFRILPDAARLDAVNNTGMTLAEGASGAITADMLRITPSIDPTETAGFVLETVPAHGTLTRVAGSRTETLDLGSFVSQADIDGGRILYTHNGDEAVSDQFEFKPQWLSPRGGPTATFTGFLHFDVSITGVNDLPVRASNIALFAVPGQAVMLAGRLSYTDADDPADQLTYTLTRPPAHGNLYLNGNPVAESGTFTQDDINRGLVQYIHTGAHSLPDSFAFSVRDRSGASNAGTVSIAVSSGNAAPVAAVNTGLTADESLGSDLSGVLLTLDNFAAIDPEMRVNFADLQVEILQPPSHGFLAVRNDSRWVRLPDGQSFPMARIAGNAVAYVNDGTEATSDTVRVRLREPGTGGAVSEGVTIPITITARNDSPVIRFHSATFPVTERTTLNEAGEPERVYWSHFMVADAENPPARITYTVQELPNPILGAFARNGVALRVGDSFTQEDINRGLITFDRGTYEPGATPGALPGSTRFSFRVSDGERELTLASDLRVEALNEPPVGRWWTPWVAEGGRLTISDGMLHATDVDTPPAEIVYTLTRIPAQGTLFRNGAALRRGDTFTQADILAGRIEYRHAGGEAHADLFEAYVTDGRNRLEREPYYNSSLPRLPYLIAIAPVDDVPRLVNNRLTVTTGQTQVIQPQNLRLADADNTPAQIHYQVDTLPAQGTLRLSGAPLQVGDTFTQADINDRRLSYAHAGRSRASDQFEFTAQDGVGGSITRSMQITVATENRPPSLSASRANFAVSEGGSVDLAGRLPQVTDSDSAPGELFFVVSAPPSRGHLARDGVRLSSGDRFSLAELAHGRITYRHDGGESTADEFTVRLLDTAGNNNTDGGPVTVAVTVRPEDDPPELAANRGLALWRGASVAVASGLLRVTDIDTPEAQITYRITAAPGEGRLFRNGVELRPGSTFTQVDINAGIVVYRHNDGEATSDRFTFMVAENGVDRLGPITVPVTITNNHLPSVVSLNQVKTYTEDGPRVALDPITVTERDDGDTIAATLRLADPRAGTLTGGSGARYDAATGVLEARGTPAEVTRALSALAFLPAANYDADTRIAVTVTDRAGAARTGTIDLRATPVNDPPQVAAGRLPTVLTARPNQSSPFTYRLPPDLFTDIDSRDSLTLGVSLRSGAPLPSWLSFNPATRTFTGTPRDTDAGEIQIQVTATDRSGASAVAQVSVRVPFHNSAPVVSVPLSDRTVDAAQRFTYPIPAGTFTDADGHRLVYRANLADGRPLPSWLTVNPFTGELSGVPSGRDFGVLRIAVTAVDPFAGTASAEFDLVVRPPSGPIVTPGTGPGGTPTTGTTPPANPDGTTGPQAPGRSGTNMIVLPAVTRTAGTRTAGTSLTMDSLDTSVRQIVSPAVVEAANSAQSTNDTSSIAQLTNVLNSLAAEPAGSSSATGSGAAPPAADPAAPAPPPATTGSADARSEAATPATIFPSQSGTGAAAAPPTQTGPSGTESLFVASSIGNHALAPGESRTIQIPNDIFQSLNPGTAISVHATLADGSNLPPWLSFDPGSGTFNVDAPPGQEGTVEIRVIARDDQGNEVSTTFQIRIGEGGASPGGSRPGGDAPNLPDHPQQDNGTPDRRSSAPGEPGDGEPSERVTNADPAARATPPGPDQAAARPALLGKPSLSMQLRALGRHALQAEQQALIDSLIASVKVV